MKQKNKINAIAVMIALAVLSLGCGSLMPKSNTGTAANTSPSNITASNSTATSNSSNTTSSSNSSTSSTIEKADFTVTSEELDKEFHKEGVTDKDLEKYANKNIAVTARVSTLVLEKKGTVQPWVTLYAPGVLRGVISQRLAFSMSTRRLAWVLGTSVRADDCLIVFMIEVASSISALARSIRRSSDSSSPGSRNRKADADR